MLRIERWRLPSGRPTIWKQIERIVADSPGVTPEAAARLIEIEHMSGVISVTPELRRLFARGGELKISLPIHNTMSLETAEYTLFVQTLSESVQLQLEAPQRPTSSSIPIIRWMGQVRDVLENLPLNARR